MKKIAKASVAILCISAITGTAFAAKPGSYIGGGLGAANVDSPSIPKANGNLDVTDSKSSGSNLAGRIFSGYNFNQYFGIEAGLAKYPNVKRSFKGNYNHNYHIDNFSNTYGNLEVVNVFNSEGKREVSNLLSFDIVAKGYLPLSDTGLNLYGLAGLAYVHSKDVTTYTAGDIKEAYVNEHKVKPLQGYSAPADYSYKKSKSGSAVHPIYGVGVSYDIPQSNFVTNLEWTRLQGSTNVFGNHESPNANMWTFNIAYNLGY